MRFKKMMFTLWIKIFKATVRDNFMYFLNRATYTSSTIFSAYSGIVKKIRTKIKDFVYYVPMNSAINR